MPLRTTIRKNDDLYLSLRGKSAKPSPWRIRTGSLPPSALFKKNLMAEVHLRFRFAILISCATKNVLLAVITRRITRFIFTRIFHADCIPAAMSAGWGLKLQSALVSHT